MRVINDKTNEIIADYADGKRVHFLNINDHFLADDGTLPREVMPDLLHPKSLAIKSGQKQWSQP